MPLPNIAYLLIRATAGARLRIRLKAETQLAAVGESNTGLLMTSTKLAVCPCPPLRPYHTYDKS